MWFLLGHLLVVGSVLALHCGIHCGGSKIGGPNEGFTGCYSLLATIGVSSTRVTLRDCLSREHVR